MRKCGRRWSLGCSLLLCSITCAAGGFISEGGRILHRLEFFVSDLIYRFIDLPLLILFRSNCAISMTLTIRLHNTRTPLLHKHNTTPPTTATLVQSLVKVYDIITSIRSFPIRLSCLIDFPGTHPTNDRRPFIDLTWAVMSLFLIGKLGITISFAVLYTYTAEMMPTCLRSCGVGASSTCARFGAMLAPFVPLLVNDLNQ